MRSAPSASAVVAVNLIAHGTWGWLEPAQPTPRLNQLCGASPEGYISLDVLTLNTITRGRQLVTRVINPKYGVFTRISRIGNQSQQERLHWNELKNRRAAF